MLLASWLKLKIEYYIILCINASQTDALKGLEQKVVEKKDVENVL